jgi:hypothetical protein
VVTLAPVALALFSHSDIELRNLGRFHRPLLFLHSMDLFVDINHSLQTLAWVASLELVCEVFHATELARKFEIICCDNIMKALIICRYYNPQYMTILKGKYLLYISI